LFTKKLERGRFLWPSLADGVVTISIAQLSYLLSGIDWRMPHCAVWRSEEKIGPSPVQMPAAIVPPPSTP
jgi:transposase